MLEWRLRTLLHIEVVEEALLDLQSPVLDQLLLLLLPVVLVREARQRGSEGDHAARGHCAWRALVLESGAREEEADLGAEVGAREGELVKPCAPRLDVALVQQRAVSRVRRL